MIQIFRLIGAVRLPQLSKQFLIDKVGQNQFVMGSERCMEMVTKAMEIHSGTAANRSSSSRSQIYVFPDSYETQTHITMYSFSVLIFFTIFLLLVSFNCATNDSTTSDLPQPLQQRKKLNFLNF